MADKELERWTELAHSITDEDRVRHTPPPSVWANINAAVENDLGELPDHVRDVTSGDELEHSSFGADEILPPEEVIDLNAARNTPAPAARRKRQRQLLLAGAAAALAFVVGLSLFSGGGEPVTTFAAEVANTNLPETFDGSASATVAVDDSPMLEIDFEGELPEDEPVELWLINKDDLTDMRSLGIIDPATDSWSGVWPADLDPTVYSVVDLSLEPADGDPTHSGRSFLRGALTEI